jgi:co-chaperonin GroES (HSP10)
MTITPTNQLLLVKKHKNSALSADIIVEETDEDKTLITGEVLSSDSKVYPQGTTIVFGKYSLFPLNLKGEVYHFLNEKDIVATTDFKE